jgi:RND family efflux transporter MFP subunit
MQNNTHHRPQFQMFETQGSTYTNLNGIPMPPGTSNLIQLGFMPLPSLPPIVPTNWQIGNNASGATPPPTGWATPLPFASQPTYAPSMVRKKRPHIAYIVGGAVIGIVILLGSMLALLWFMTKTSAGVTLYQVSEQNVTQYVGGGGIVYPQQQFDLSYALPERVVSVFIKAGDKVTKNEPLIQLDPSQLNAQITQAANNMAAAQAYLNSVSSNGNSLTIAQAQQAYNQAKDRYNALVAEYSSPLVHNGALISPMNGIVTSVNINPGEVFQADASLLTIMDESRVIVHVEIPLSYLGKVQLGQSSVVTPSALPNLSFNGTVSSVIPQADPQTDTFEVWVEVPNPQDNLLPGMSAFVRIQQKLTAIVVPRLAVLNPDRESIVFIVRGQHAYIQHVNVIGRSIDTLFVSTGLKVHDLVVLVGSYDLQDGQAVKVLKVETQTS